MSTLSLFDIVRRAIPAAPRVEGECIPWNDPGFSARVLNEHLSQDSDLASRRGSIIERHVAWLDADILGARRSRVLDLCCGPGLYLQRLARRGHAGVGIDCGPASIAYARGEAEREGLPLEFVEGDLRTEGFGSQFDLVTFIYGQLNVFARAEAWDLLVRARAALRPGGRVVVEPQTMEAVRGSAATQSSWSSSERGLFSDSPHITLYERVWDEETRSATERWFVIDAATGHVARHAQTTEAYSTRELVELLERAGFDEVRVLPELPGSPAGGGLCALEARR